MTIRNLNFALGALCVGIYLVWFFAPSPYSKDLRVPIEHPKPDRSAAAQANPGLLITGSADPADWPGYWPQFRGADMSNIAQTDAPLARSWDDGGLPVRWQITVGEGHAGAVVSSGSLYLIDYDRDKEEDAIRRLALDTGRDIWRYTYSVSIKRNHGMSRTVPALGGGYVVTLGPLCHLVCLDAETGELVWQKDLVEEYDTVIPPWYAGQCPIIDDGLLILAPGGSPLMVALRLDTGEEVWRTTERDGAGMTHSSVLPIDFEGRRIYVYCARDGVHGIEAGTGRHLWFFPDWRINIANIPTPIQVDADRLFFTGGYGAGSMMVRLSANDDDTIAVEELFRLRPNVFGADQQTPILYQGHLYGVISNGEFACIDLEGDRKWSSGTRRFGLGPYMLINDLFYVLNDMSGELSLVQASASGFQELTSTVVLPGHDAWAPMAVAENQLIVRDMTEMVCLDLSGR